MIELAVCAATFLICYAAGVGCTKIRSWWIDRQQAKLNQMMDKIINHDLL